MWHRAVCTMAPRHSTLAPQCPGALGHLPGQVQYPSRAISEAGTTWKIRAGALLLLTGQLEGGRGALCHDLSPPTAVRKRGCLQGRDFPNSSLAPFNQGSPPYPLLPGLLWHQQPLLSFPTQLY